MIKSLDIRLDNGNALNTSFSEKWIEHESDQSLATIYHGFLLPLKAIGPRDVYTAIRTAMQTACAWLLLQVNLLTHSKPAANALNGPSLEPFPISRESTDVVYFNAKSLDRDLLTLRVFLDRLM